MIHPGIQQVLRDQLGLEVGSLSPSALRQAIRQRMDACGLRTEQEYGQLLRIDPEEQQGLFENLVVPETWFFRDREAFELLSYWAQRNWPDPGTSRSLRLLSMACSTGEEPYSMAMTLLEAGRPPESFYVRALDISQRALDRAAAGVYGPRSWREASPGYRQKYFQVNHGQYALLPLVRDRVRFFRANLFGDNLTKPGERYDVIFCRNVLIYLHDVARHHALRVIRDLLEPSGILVTGPAEAGWLVQFGFSPVGKPRAFAFQCATTASSRGRVPSHRPARAKPRMMEKRVTAPAEAKPARCQHAELVKPSLAEARKLADGGSLAEAATVCEQLLHEDNVKTDVHYLLGVIYDALGQLEAAETHYRRTVYLDPDHAEALLHLALMAERRGDHVRALALKQRLSRIQSRV
jgi:chemotaxis protein methyltransferase WspC